MKFGVGKNDFRPQKTENKSTLKKLKLTITSSPGLKIGCCVIVVILFYILGLVTTTACVVVGITTYLWTSDSTGFSRNDKASISEEKFESLKRETENYRLARDQTLQKLSPLKSDNENLQSQIERQYHQIDGLISDLGRMEKEHRSSLNKKIEISNELLVEKRKNNLERQDMKTKMEEAEERHRLEIEHVNMVLDQKDKDQNSLTQLLENSKKNQERLTQQFKAAIMTMESERAVHQKDREDLEKCKDLIFDKEEKMKKIQNLHWDTIKHLEESMKTIKEQTVEIDHLKLRLENSAKESDTGKLTCNICEDKERNTFLDPCGHTLCNECADKVINRNRKCPVCRKYIAKTSNLYFS